MMATLLKYVVSMFFTLVLMWAALDVNILTHEWTHSTIAWLNGVKQSPFDIYYGDWTLLHVDEAINYTKLLAEGKSHLVALIAILPVTVNAILALICFQLMKSNEIQKQKWTYTFIFWFAAFSLSEVFSYIPIRTFTTHADIFNFDNALHLSPYFVGIVGGIFSMVCMIYFFIVLLPKTYAVLGLNDLAEIFYLCASIFIFLFMGGCRGLYDYGPVSATMGHINLALIPIVFLLCFPKWKWIRLIKKKSATV